MNNVDLQRTVSEMLGFRIVERGHDALVEFMEEPDFRRVRAVHPATLQEAILYLKLIGIVARLDELSTTYAMALEANAHLQVRVLDSAQAASDALAEANKLRAQRDDAEQVANLNAEALRILHDDFNALRDEKSGRKGRK